MRDRPTVEAELQRLDRLRAKSTDAVTRASVSSAMDTLRWVLGERAVLAPAALNAIQRRPEHDS